MLTGATMTTERFYDDLAGDYHLNYHDWHEAVPRQGRVLAALIREATGNQPDTVLDCTCGIGTQAIGLALAGRVTRRNWAEWSGPEKGGNTGTVKDRNLSLPVAPAATRHQPPWRHHGAGPCRVVPSRRSCPSSVLADFTPARTSRHRSTRGRLLELFPSRGCH